jgi:hypothetical protein
MRTDGREVATSATETAMFVISATYISASYEISFEAQISKPKIMNKC